MKTINQKTDVKNKFNADILILCLCVASVLFIAWTFTGQWPWKGQSYNSYILQAQSWLKGRLDLGQDYPYLELAIFNNKYFVSFPPFPSYVMLPFVLLGWNTCDSMIAFATSLLGAVYAYKILTCFNIEGKKAVFFSLFLTIASNWLMTAQNAWVWFIAQNMAFTLSLMAIYYALKNKAGLSLLFWACTVGCRPLQILYIPVLLYLLYRNHKAENSDDKLTDIIKKRYLAVIPMAVVALSYMILNYARFGSIIEFGHNYLPEFMRVKEGQFHVSYILKNLASIVRLPDIVNGKLSYPVADGMCMFMVSPIIIAYFVYIARTLIKKTERDNKLIIMIIVTVLVEILLITAHKTMGGSHFGNRYTNDTLPLMFLGIASLIPKDKTDVCEYMCYPLFFIGLSLNLIGTVGYYCNFFN